jgi:hypothetical protein
MGSAKAFFGIKQSDIENIYSNAQNLLNKTIVVDDEQCKSSRNNTMSVQIEIFIIE